ncbi:reverse transcriptase, partial [Tanacetum coccineum]
EKPKDWVKWIPLAEYWYNINYHSAIDTTPYEVVYGQAPPMHIPYMAKDSPVEAVDMTLQAREQVVQLLKFNLKQLAVRQDMQMLWKRLGRKFNYYILDTAYRSLLDTAYRSLLDTAYRSSWFLVKGRHGYTISSIIDMAFRMSEHYSSDFFV